MEWPCFLFRTVQKDNIQSLSAHHCSNVIDNVDWSRDKIVLIGQEIQFSSLRDFNWINYVVQDIITPTKSMRTSQGNHPPSFVWVNDHDGSSCFGDSTISPDSSLKKLPPRVHVAAIRKGTYFHRARKQPRTQAHGRRFRGGQKNGPGGEGCSLQSGQKLKKKQELIACSTVPHTQWPSIRSKTGRQQQKYQNITISCSKIIHRMTWRHPWQRNCGGRHRERSKCE